MAMSVVISKRQEFEEVLKTEQEAWNRRRVVLELEILELRRLEAAGEVLVGDVQVAKQFLDIEGVANVTERPGRAAVLRDAALDIAEGSRHLRAAYMGVKTYERFGDQREDHPYGYAPRHGHIVFRVGLRYPARGSWPEGQQVEACVRVLTAMAEGKLLEL